MLKILKTKKTFWLGMLAVFLASLFASRSLFKPGYFPMHDDIHVLRMEQMEKCFQDGQIPCRWSPDLGAGFGQPLFNYYSPLAFYLGMLGRVLGWQYIDSVKLVFGLSLVVSGIFMFLLVREFFGEQAGVLGAILFLFAPYRAVNVYVRGALAESVALAILPAVFWAIYKLMKTGKSFWLISLTLIFSLFFLSHNITLMISLPFLILWTILWWQKDKSHGNFLRVAGVFFWSLGLAAHFLLPAFLEKDLVMIDSLRGGYNDFHLHFVYFGQLFFLRYWDYGSSLGADSRMSFQIGWPHWWLVIGLFLFLIFLAFKKRDSRFWAAGFFLALFWAAGFLTHRRSVLIWENLPFLPLVQFPWRFLGLVSLGSAFSGAALVSFVQERLKKKPVKLGLLVSLVFLVMSLNYSFFQPSQMHHWINDRYKLSGREREKQMKSAMIDFMPKTVSEISDKLAPAQPRVIQGIGESEDFFKKTNSWQFKAKVSGENPALFEVPVFYFPDWEVFVDQKKVEAKHGNKRGLIEVSVAPGGHQVLGEFKNTPFRAAANLISLISFFLLISFCLLKRLRLK